MSKCLTSEDQGLVTLPEMTAWPSGISPDVGETPQLTTPVPNVVTLSDACPESILLVFSAKLSRAWVVPRNETILT